VTKQLLSDYTLGILFYAQSQYTKYMKQGSALAPWPNIGTGPMAHHLYWPDTHFENINGQCQ